MEAGAAIYFAKHHADDGWMHKAHRLQQVPPGPLRDINQPGQRTLEGIELEVPAPSRQAGCWSSAPILCGRSASGTWEPEHGHRPLTRRWSISAPAPCLCACAAAGWMTAMDPK